MNTNEIELHIRKVTQNENSVNPLLKECIEYSLHTKYNVDGYPIESEKEEIIIFAINKAKMLLNSCKYGITLNFRGENINRYLPSKTELHNEWNLLEKAFAIVKEANDIDSDFF